MTEGTSCALHPQEAVIGACQRCGDFVCRLCLKGKRLVCFKCAPHGDGTRPDLDKALRFVFKDPDYVRKVLVGAACFFGGALCILPLFLLMGYGMRVARREQEEPQGLLPEWDDLGDLFMTGLKLWVTQLLPGMVMALTIGLVVGLVVALGVVGGAAGNAAGGVAAGVAAFGMFGAFLLIIPLSLAFAVAAPAIHVHHLRTGRVTAGLEFRELWRMIAGRFGDYIMLFLFHFLVQMIGTFVGELACGVGLFVTIPWMLIVQSYLVGRYAAFLDAEEGPVPA